MIACQIILEPKINLHLLAINHLLQGFLKSECLKKSTEKRPLFCHLVKIRLWWYCSEVFTVSQWIYRQCKVTALQRASLLLITSIGNIFLKSCTFQINFQGFQLEANKWTRRHRAIPKLRYDAELKSVVILLEMPHCQIVLDYFYR